MKKFVFSIMIASIAIRVMATELGKLPAIVIDDLYFENDKKEDE